jgi:branched-chain amino acid transport system ATP-binding protein
MTAVLGSAPPPLLSVRALQAGYDQSVVLEDASLEIGCGEVVCLLGPNGAGKTTLMRCITGLLAIKGGDILLDGASITAVPAHRRVDMGISLVPEGKQVFPALSVEENLVLGSFPKRARKRCRQNLDRVYSLYPRLNERRHQRAGLLSGGEQQMLALGRALMAEPRLLLLDEPSLGLAPKIIIGVFETIVGIAAMDISILIVEQNIVAALAVASRGYVLGHGRTWRSGSAESLKQMSAQDALIGEAAAMEGIDRAMLTRADGRE